MENQFAIHCNFTGASMSPFSCDTVPLYAKANLPTFVPQYFRFIGCKTLTEDIFSLNMATHIFTQGGGAGHSP